MTIIHSNVSNPFHSITEKSFSLLSTVIMDNREKKHLVEKAKGGDMDCFHILFGHLRSALQAKAYCFFGYGSQAKDALQETFIISFLKIHQLRSPAKFNSWIHSILRNQCLLIKRDEKKKFPLDHVERYDPSFLKSLQSKNHLADSRNYNFLNILASLDEKKRAVILLRFYSEFNSYREIANILNIPIGTVRSTLSIAKAELRNIISHHSDPTLFLEPNVNSIAKELKIAEAWSELYNGERKSFLSRFDEDVQLRFSSGKTGRGIQRWAAEWDVDLINGVRFIPNLVTQSGNITIVEGPIINPPDKPNLCPPEAGFVFFHNKKNIYRTHLHYAARKK